MVPLHPVVVHFPIVLAVLLPISAAWALWAIRKGTTFRRVWAVPAAMAFALALSAFVAVETGESADERVERVVPEQPLESHEEAAETFLTLSAGLALLVSAGLVRGRAGDVARGLGTAGAVALVAVATYFANTLGPTTDFLAWTQKISPFYYYSGGQPLVNGLQVGDSLVLAGTAVVLVVIGIGGFVRRDVGV